jgi:hypothetical protein
VSVVQFNLRRIGIAAVVFACSACSAAAGSTVELAETWEASPYRIGASLAIDAPGDLAAQLAAELPGYLHDRVNTSIGVVWRLKTELAHGPLRQRMLRGLDDFSTEDVANAPEGEDKRLLLSVRATPWGYELTAREFDRYVERWGPPIERTVRQRDALAEQLFELAVQAISPLAHVRQDSKNPRQVAFDLRGSDLPASGPDFAWTRPGDVFQPMLRRTTRDGVLVPGGVTIIPWTYLEVVESPASATQPLARIRNVTQRPLGVRRGRVEQIAIGLRNDPGDMTLELRSRVEKEKPLVGYDVLAQNMDEKETRLLGASNSAGDVTVSPGKSAVQMLYVKSGGLTLAALPVVPGAEDRVEVWLPDDDMRLRAAARLEALREDIVDLVARRTIYIARIRQRINDKNLQDARRLLASLDELPGQSQFNIALDRESQELRSKDVQVQRRIDRLFAETRTALGKFLDPQPIGVLHEELRQAEEAQGTSGEEKTTGGPGDKETG